MRIGRWPSGDWDAWNTQGGPKYPHEKVIQFCFRNFPPTLRAGVRVLDLGCGSGVHTAFLAAEGFTVTGVDPSKAGIANTRQRLAALGLDATLQIQRAEALDFPADSFDLVICVGVFDAAGPENARAAVGKLSEILAPGAQGMFLFASDRDFRVGVEHPFGLIIHGYPQDEVERMFAGSFKQVWIDRYITTYERGRYEQNDWLVTIRN